jgi:hypothetical protein
LTYFSALVRVPPNLRFRALISGISPIPNVDYLFLQVTPPVSG